MQKVYETGFALDEATLYLDTHPEDSQAMEYYQYVKRASQSAVSAYEQTWTWVNDPWPWEGGN